MADVSPGRALEHDLLDEYEFRADELVVVRELCHLADDLFRLRRELADRPFTVDGSKGQPVIDPLRVELHRVSARFESLARSLGFPAETDALARSDAGRKMALARWSG